MTPEIDSFTAPRETRRFLCDEDPGICIKYSQERTYINAAPKLIENCTDIESYVKTDLFPFTVWSFHNTRSFQLRYLLGTSSRKERNIVSGELNMSKRRQTIHRMV